MFEQDFIDFIGFLNRYDVDYMFVFVYLFGN